MLQNSGEHGLELVFASNTGADDVVGLEGHPVVCTVCHSFYTPDSEWPLAPLPRTSPPSGEGGWFAECGKAAWRAARCACFSLHVRGLGGHGSRVPPP